MKERIYNTNATEIDLTRRYNQDKAWKPHGLWYGFGDAWLEWCESEMPGWIKPHNFFVDVSKANILRLKTDADIIRFTEENGVSIVPGLTMLARNINWSSVALRYDGFEVPKYLWKWRLDPRTLWYYGFDCASGCVWNLGKIKITEVT